MWVVMPYPAQADAGFSAGPHRCDEPSVSRVRQAAAAAVRAFGHSRRTGQVAQYFGDHPETPVMRTRCARATAGWRLQKSALEHRSCADADELVVDRLPVSRPTDPNCMTSVALRDDRYGSDVW